MKHGSLFSGIGGIDLGFEMAGIQTLWTCEIDDWANKLLQKRFPLATHYRDIKDIGAHNLEGVDVISGGFPCQDISTAGKGAGLKGARSGLWFEMWRIISELRPRWVLIENVANLTFKGGARVLHDLAEIGYDAEWQIISARDVGARHLRKRIWIIAYPREVSNSERKRFSRSDLSPKVQGGNEVGKKQPSESSLQNRSIKLSNSESIGHRRSSGKKCRVEREGKLQQEEQKRNKVGSKTKRRSNISSQSTSERRTKQNFEEKDKRNGRFKLRTFDELKSEPRLDRVAYGLSQKVDRYNDRIKGLGNAVIPQIPYLIGRKLIELNNKEKNNG